jgi:hypothetical protein
VSYTTINGMRSARYPLQGVGACHSCSATGTVEETANKYAWAIPLSVGVVVGLGALFWKGKPPKKNRRRRRRLQ